MTAEALLSGYAVGQRGKIAGFDLPAARRQRLQEMGLTVGCPFEVVRFAPMGDPIEIKVRGYFLSLRREEALKIGVQEL